MNDDLDQNLSASLHRRAHAAPTDGMHFGDVRRRVRRRRQRHIALGVAPALVGVGYLATRPVAEPTQSADSVDTTSAGIDSTIEVATTSWGGGNVLPFRCLDESEYDSSGGWSYFVTCEQLPPMTAPGQEQELVVDTTWAGEATTTSIEYWPGAEQCGHNTLPPTTSPDGASTTTIDPRVENACGIDTTVSTTIVAP